jgi:MerR family transcriptional regulator, aldehyde-responsive regulator
MTTANEAAWATIQQVSRRSGLSEPTLRYYEQIGLLGTVARDERSGHRRYDHATVERIDALACLRAAGVGVAEMRAYLRLLARGDEAAPQQRELYARHADRLSAQIEQLQLRLEYLRLKAQLWDARDRADGAAEQRAMARLRAVVERF